MGVKTHWLRTTVPDNPFPTLTKLFLFKVLLGFDRHKICTHLKAASWWVWVQIVSWDQILSWELYPQYYHTKWSSAYFDVCLLKKPLASGSCISLYWLIKWHQQCKWKTKYRESQSTKRKKEQILVGSMHTDRSRRKMPVFHFWDLALYLEWLSVRFPCSLKLYNSFLWSILCEMLVFQLWYFWQKNWKEF